MTADPDDAALLRTAAAGDPGALTRLYAAHVDSLYAFAFYRAGRDPGLAEDIVQEGEVWRVTTDPHDLHKVRTAIEEGGFKVESGDLAMVAQNLVAIEGLDDKETSAPDVPKGATSNATPAPLPYPSKQQEAMA